MRIGIIGTGNLGARMGKTWAAKGHEVLFSFSKEPEKLREAAAVGSCRGGASGSRTPARKDSVQLR